jgi:hypothetical protein
VSAPFNEMMLAAAVELAAAETALDVWIDAVLVGRSLGDPDDPGNRLDSILAVTQLMIQRGAVPAEGSAAGLLAAALDRLADQKEREGHVPAGLED